jgi:hypothetical protein
MRAFPGPLALYIILPRSYEHAPRDKAGRYCGSRVARAMMQRQGSAGSVRTLARHHLVSSPSSRTLFKVQRYCSLLRRAQCHDIAPHLEPLRLTAFLDGLWGERVTREVLVSSSNAPRIAGSAHCGLCAAPNGSQTPAQSERLEKLFTVNKETTVSRLQVRRLNCG